MEKKKNQRNSQPEDKNPIYINPKTDFGFKRLFMEGVHAKIRLLDLLKTFFPDPLRGPNIDELGTRFPDMSHVYDPALCACIRAAADAAGIPLREGVYCQLTGPCFETPAEIRMLSILGASAVGMSTACEAAAANHAGMRVCGVSCITNQAAGLSKTPLTHEEVKEAGLKAAALFETLVRGSIRNIGKELR